MTYGIKESTDSKFDKLVHEVLTRYRKENGYHWLITDYYIDLYGLQYVYHTRRIPPEKIAWWRKLASVIGRAFAKNHRRKSEAAVQDWCMTYAAEQQARDGDLN